MKSPEKINRSRDLRKGVKKTGIVRRHSLDNTAIPDDGVCNSESEEDERSTLMSMQRIKLKKKNPKIFKRSLSKSMDDVRRNKEHTMTKARSADDLLNSQKRKVNEIAEIMKGNIIKIRDRDGKLDDLMEKGSRLEMATEVFLTTTKDLKRKKFWELMKFRIAVAVFLSVVVVVIVIVVVVVTVNNNNESSHSSQRPKVANTDRP